MQIPGLDMGHAAGCYFFRRCEGGNAQRQQHIRCQGAARLGAHAVQQHGQPLARQQQRQQRREHGQLARTVVAGQHDHGAVAGRKKRHPAVGGAEKAAHFLGRFALDAHGQAEGADFQIGHVAVEQLAKQVCRLLAREWLGAAGAATDFFDVLANAHVFWWRDLCNRAPASLFRLAVQAYCLRRKCLAGALLHKSWCGGCGDVGGWAAILAQSRQLLVMWQPAPCAWTPVARCCAPCA